MTPEANSITHIAPQTGLVAGRITLASGAAAVTDVSGPTDNEKKQVSVAFVSTGIVDISIANFRGQYGKCIALLTPIADVYMWHDAPTYSGDKVTVRCNVHGAADQSFDFLFFAI